jgi:glycosyltransferase involved in cell wall biosynthesis
METFVSIIIPTYKDWIRLRLCLLALQQQTYPANCFEVIVVNNEPSDLLPPDLQLAGNVVLLAEEKPGSYAARNTGLRVAKGSVIGFTDSDCVPDKDWIRNAVEFFSKHRNCLRIAGRIKLFSKAVKLTKAEAYEMVYAFNQKSYVSNAGTSVTANMFVQKHIFDAVGFFNEKLMSGGDFSWGVNANDAGYSIAYAENIVVAHPARYSVAELVTKEKRVGGGQGVFLPAKQNNLKKLFAFLKEIRPRFSEFKRVFHTKANLTTSEKISVLFLRHYLLVVRGYERYKVQIGKTTNRL